jgi:hypothetical protein
MRRPTFWLLFWLLTLGPLLLALPGCRRAPRSRLSYDQIRGIVLGKTAAEVERLLGQPDVREPLLGDQRWIWWDYTFLDGADYAPEERGQPVHLEIILQDPASSGEASRPVEEWRVGGPLGVSYMVVRRRAEGVGR